MKVQSKTKVVATLGPATLDPAIFDQLIEAGVDVCRLNFSHGGRDFQKTVIDLVRNQNEKKGYNLAILADLQGPKMRIRDVENNELMLDDNEQFIISTDQGIGVKGKVYIQYENFAIDVNPGERVLVDDGKIVLEVVSSNKKNEAVVKVISGGILSSKKGVNLPNTKISLPCLTPKDIEDLNFALDHDVEW